MPTLEHECYLSKCCLYTCIQGSCVYVDIQGVGVGGHVTGVGVGGHVTGVGGHVTGVGVGGHVTGLGVVVETMSPQAASMKEMHVCHICEVVPYVFYSTMYIHFQLTCNNNSLREWANSSRTISCLDLELNYIVIL